MNQQQREWFDELVDRVVRALPAEVRALVEQVPVVIEDIPEEDVLRSLDMPLDAAEELCGLHTGVARPDAGIEDEVGVPNTVHLYRHGIVSVAGGQAASDEDIEREIRVTLLHELGHEMGLDEDDLENLGYG
ncbi:MAG: metallopeptidase family protein [Planctomycetota bacterium]